jgi:hypothetical protein
MSNKDLYEQFYTLKERALINHKNHTIDDRLMYIKQYNELGERMLTELDEKNTQDKKYTLYNNIVWWAGAIAITGLVCKTPKTPFKP